MRQSVFRIPPSWLEQPIAVVLAGVGGTGGELLDGLVRMHHALVDLGHPHGFSVTVYDPDTVSPANIGRQGFYPADIGHNKAEVLVQRYNVFCGLDWRAQPCALTPARVAKRRACDLLITCLDSAPTRMALAAENRRAFHEILWLDTGNDATTGQIVLGHLAANVRDRLPHVVDLHPEITAIADDDAPSCSLPEALARQDLTVNRAVACAALNLVWRLLRHAEIDHHGAWIDVAGNRVTPMPICSEFWASMGYSDASGDGTSDA